MPPTHCSPLPQRRPHAPQLVLFDWRLRHAPLHEVSPAEHIVTHWLASHTWPAAQARPQAPQLATSVGSCTHLLLHKVEPAPQRQAPLTHWPPAPQALPHVPQLFTSAWVKVHTPLQVAWPGKHWAWQLKPVHTWPEGHTVPQPPQLLGSLRETQVLPQRMVPAAHWQVDAEQVPPVPHDAPHAPQFAGSVTVLVHSPLQVA